MHGQKHRFAICLTLTVVLLLLGLAAAGAAFAQPALQDLVSPTHPDDTTWYWSGWPEFAWDVSPSGTAPSGYSYTLSQDPTVTPDSVVDSDLPLLSVYGWYGFETSPTPSATGAAFGDFNKDALLDVVVANEATNDVGVLLGTGSRYNLALGAYQNYATGAQPKAVVVADFNGDGYDDIATANFDKTVSVLLNDQSGGFDAKSDTAIGFLGLGLAVGNFDGGSPDLVVVGDGWSAGGVNPIEILSGDGDGTFTVDPGPTLDTFHRYATAVAVADVNGDLVSDLVVVLPGEDQVAISLGLGAGVFNLPSNYSTGVGSLPLGMAVADFDGDGQPDVATATNWNGVSVLLNDGAGGLGAPVRYDPGHGNIPTSIASADFNGDGRCDLVTTEPAAPPGAVSLLSGNGDGTFNPPCVFASGNQYLSPESVAVGDVDADGAPDVVTVNYPSVNTGAISVLFNNSNTKSFSDVGTGTWLFKVSACDASGAWGNVVERQVKIDRTPPVFLSNGFYGAEGEPGYFRSSVVAWVTVTDANAGVGSVAYGFDLGGKHGLQPQDPADLTIVDGVGTALSGAIATEGPHYVSWRAYDAAVNPAADLHNYTTVSTYDFTIDTSLPGCTANIDPTPDESGWNATPVTVALDPTDSVSGVASCQYKLGSDGDWTDYTDPIQVSSDGTTDVYCKVSDLAGNVYEPEDPVAVVSIDSVPPTVTPDVTPEWYDQTWCEGAVTYVSLGATDDGSGVAQLDYRVLDEGAPAPDEADWWSYTSSIWVPNPGQYRVWYRATDALGNSTGAQSIKVWVDGQPPSITVTEPRLGPEPYPRYEQDSSVTSSFSATDDYYLRDLWAEVQPPTGGPRTIHNGDPLPTDIVGDYKITVHANDGAHNESTSTGHYWVVPPADYLAIVVPDESPVGTPFTVTVTARDQFDNVATAYMGTVQITSSDTAGGVILPDYTFTAADQGSHIFTDGVTLVTPGTQTVGATDGELSTIGQTIRIYQPDTTPPVTTATMPPTPGSGWFKNNVTIDFVTNEAATPHYQVDGGPEQTGTPATVTTDGTHTVTYWSVDSAGNEETPKKTTPAFKIDKTPPVVTITKPMANDYYTVKQKVYSAGSVGDGSGSGVSTTAITNDTTTTTWGAALITATAGNHTFKVVSTDQAGNTTTVTVPYRVGATTDKTPPTVNITNPEFYDGQSYPRYEQLAIEFTVSDSLAGTSLARWSVSVKLPSGPTIPLPLTAVGTNGATTGVVPALTDTKGTYQATITAKDSAGQTTTVVVNYAVAADWGQGLLAFDTIQTPSSNPPEINVTTQTMVPLKFKLSGDVRALQTDSAVLQGLKPRLYVVDLVTNKLVYKAPTYFQLGADGFYTFSFNTGNIACIPSTGRNFKHIVVFCDPLGAPKFTCGGGGSDTVTTTDLTVAGADTVTELTPVTSDTGVLKLASSAPSAVVAAAAVATPVISAVAPSPAPLTTGGIASVTLTGSNFGSKVVANYVSLTGFVGTTATTFTATTQSTAQIKLGLTSWGTAKIVFTTPVNYAGTMNTWVTVGTAKSLAKPLTVSVGSATGTIRYIRGG